MEKKPYARVKSNVLLQRLLVLVRFADFIGCVVYMTYSQQ